jgi:hypothetical protein
MMRRLRAPALGLALLVGAAGGAPAQTPPGVPPDTRERLVVPPPARTKILYEMRGMLEALEGVLAALARGDRAAAAGAARAAGVAHAVDAQPQMQRLLPASFVEAGLEAHRAFDALALVLAGPGDDRAALGEVAALAGRCVACHAIYRLDEAR